MTDDRRIPMTDAQVDRLIGRLERGPRSGAAFEARLLATLEPHLREARRRDRSIAGRFSAFVGGRAIGWPGLGLVPGSQRATRVARVSPWVAAATIVALLAALLSSIAGGRPGPSPISPSPAPPSDHSPSPSATCPTDTAHVAVGSEMAPQAGTPMAIGAGIVAGGAYVTRSDGSSYVPAEIWSVQAGSSRRIATVDGPGINAVSIADVSQDDGLVLLSVGRISPSGANPECLDLYLLRSDGSSVKRLTNYSEGEMASRGRISADNRYVAFVHDFTFDASPRSGIVIFDRLATTAANREFVCGLDSWLADLAWEPGNQGVAAVCGAQISISDQTGTSAGLPFAPSQLMAFDWRPASGLVIAAARPGTPASTIDLWTLKFAGAISFPGFGSPHTVHVPFDAVTGDGAGLASPDGQYVLLEGVPIGSTGADIYGYAVRISDGSTSLVVPARGIEPSWSADSRSIVYAQAGDAGYSLVVHVLATGDESLVRPLPAGFVQGVWQRG